MGETTKSQRKFILACFFSLVSAAGMFIPPYPIKNVDFVCLVIIILGIYGGVNILEKLGWPSKK